MNVSGLTLAIDCMTAGDTKQPIGKMSFTTKVHVISELSVLHNAQKVV